MYLEPYNRPTTEAEAGRGMYIYIAALVVFWGSVIWFDSASAGTVALWGGLIGYAVIATIWEIVKKRRRRD